MTRIIERLREVVGPKGFLDEAGDMEPYLVEERRLFRGAAQAVLRPASTEEVSRIVTLCAEARLPIVPQGGNTGLVGGGVPSEDGNSVVVSLARLDRIRALDPGNFTLTAEAGCILADLQKAASGHDRLFPLSLGAEGSCRIGGNLSTNAGGVGVLRYGNARDLVLGLEVVLPDGRVWNGLRALRKDNTGYDLKHLFVGAEGTLGIITAATLKLFPKPRQVETALIAFARVDDAMAAFARARAASSDLLTAYELLPRLALDLTVKHVAGVADPLAQEYPWYALVEASASQSEPPLREALEKLLAETMEAGLVQDGVIAASAAQAAALWRIREGIVEAQTREGASIKHDVSVPVGRVADFIIETSAAVEQRLPGIRVCSFGHAGDGNIHYNLTQPAGMDPASYLALWPEMNRLVHDRVASRGGSISAEHGIGRLKRDELKRYKAPLELELMARVKQALDPHGIMNPGKVLPP